MSCFAIHCSKRGALSYEKKFSVSAVEVKKLHEVTERICVAEIESFV